MSTSHDAASHHHTTAAVVGVTGGHMFDGIVQDDVTRWPEFRVGPVLAAGYLL